jgi:hypothetical protein
VGSHAFLPKIFINMHVHAYIQVIWARKYTYLSLTAVWQLLLGHTKPPVMCACTCENSYHFKRVLCAYVSECIRLDTQSCSDWQRGTMASHVLLYFLYSYWSKQYFLYLYWSKCISYIYIDPNRLILIQTVLMIPVKWHTCLFVHRFVFIQKASLILVEKVSVILVEWHACVYVDR